MPPFYQGASILPECLTLTKWSSDWLLSFNPDKCKVLKVVKNTFMDHDHVMQNHTLQVIS